MDGTKYFFAVTTPLLSIFTGKYKSRKVIFPVPLKTKESVLLVKDLMRQGKFMPVIDRSYTLDTIDQAFRYVEKGEKTGNVIIQIQKG